MERDEIIVIIAKINHAIVRDRVQKMGAGMRGVPEGAGPGQAALSIPAWYELPNEMKRMAFEDASRFYDSMEISGLTITGQKTVTIEGKVEGDPAAFSPDEVIGGRSEVAA